MTEEEIADRVGVVREVVIRAANVVVEGIIAVADDEADAVEGLRAVVSDMERLLAMSYPKGRA